VDVFKRKLAAEKAEAERKARAEAEAKRREAEKAARKADAADIEAQREAAEAMEAAKQAQAEAAAASKDTVKGLRTVTKYEVTDHRALLHWIAKNDRDAITAFVDEYARRNHRDIVGAEGLNVWQEKVAF
jgi:membrane protein involved in colicin uptake